MLQNRCWGLELLTLAQQVFLLSEPLSCPCSLLDIWLSLHSQEYGQHIYAFVFPLFLGQFFEVHRVSENWRFLMHSLRQLGLGFYNYILFCNCFIFPNTGVSILHAVKSFMLYLESWGILFSTRTLKDESRFVKISQPKKFHCYS